MTATRTRPKPPPRRNPKPPAKGRADQGGASIAIIFGLLILVAVVYGRVTGHSFVLLDDDVYIQDNPHVSRGLSWDGVIWAFTSFYSNNWHPLTWISHMLDAQLFGVTPEGAGGHHLVSAALHALNAVLLFLACRRMTGLLWPSALVAALFAVHPLRVESVAWASERKDVLSGLFFMLGLIAYARHAERPGLGRYSIVLLALAAGLLAKPMLVTVPFVLLLLDLWPLGRWRPGWLARSAMPRGTSAPARPISARPLSALLLEKLPLLALCAASSLATITAQGKSGAVIRLSNLPLAWRLVELPIAYATYLWKTVWPAGLAVFYPHPGISPLESIGHWLAPAALSGLFLAAVTAAMVPAARTRPYLLVGWLWFLVMLVPVIGLVQVGNQSWADRYAYLPLIGISLMAAFGIHDFVTRHRGAKVVAAVAASGAIVALAAAASLQVGRWRDSRTLFEHTLLVTKNNWLIHVDLGVLLIGEGRWEEARPHFEEAARIDPRFSEAQNTIGYFFLRDGDLQPAAHHLERALQIRPAYAEAHLNLADVLHQQGKPGEARAHFEQALTIRPGDAEAHYRFGLVLRAEGKSEEARRHFAEAVRLKPGDPESELALAAILAVSPEASPSERAEALALARRVAERTQYRDSGPVATLAAACAAAGRFDEAVQWQTQALALAPDTLKPTYRAYLERYRARKPLTAGNGR